LKNDFLRKSDNQINFFYENTNFKKCLFFVIKENLNNYGEKELEELIDFYGIANEPNYPMPIIDADAIRDEWDNFKAINFSKL